MAVAVTVLSESAGSGLGYLFHLIFISDDKNYDPIIAREEIYTMCLAAAVIVTCAYLITFTFFRAKPPIPPTYFIFI